MFGGALDNAIEASMKIEDHDRRMIHIKAMEQKGFLVICFENINDTPLEYDNEKLISTKQNKSEHGYGIKGIQYVAEKHGGTVKFAQDGDWFRLTVLIKE